jgi:hypothetical protein
MSGNSQIAQRIKYYSKNSACHANALLHASEHASALLVFEYRVCIVCMRYVWRDSVRCRLKPSYYWTHPSWSDRKEQKNGVFVSVLVLKLPDIASPYKRELTRYARMKIRNLAQHANCTT